MLARMKLVLVQSLGVVRMVMSVKPLPHTLITAEDQVPTVVTQLLRGCRKMFQCFQGRNKKLTDIFKGAAQCRKQKKRKEGQT